MQQNNKKSNKLVFPGTLLASELEYIAGKNCYVRDDGIYSSVVGIANYDENAKTVNVQSEKALHPLQINDYVLANVYLVKENYAMAYIFYAFDENKKKKVAVVPHANIYIAEIANEFINDVREWLKITDIVKARVKGITSYWTFLTIKDPNLGVISAYCTKCKSKLSFQDKNILYCSNCASTEKRKTSNDYGLFVI